MPQISILPRLSISEPCLALPIAPSRRAEEVSGYWQSRPIADKPAVSIIIPTFRRNAYLKKALDSCLGQRTHDGAPFEIVVVDNSPERLAKEVVEGFDGEGIDIRYCHEPRPGISHARNRGFAEARGEFFALLDDDEQAKADWLFHLSQTQRRFDADVVFGPVVPSFENEPGDDRPFLTAFYTYSLDVASGTRVGVRATNNALVRRRCLDDRVDKLFDTELGLTGGEDTLFFSKLEARGSKFVWSSKAEVEEAIAADRTEWRSIWKRAFQRGQCRASTPMLLPAPRLDKTIFWMLFGAMQIITLLPLAALLWFPSRQHALICAWKTTSGLGKILWMKHFRKQAYGAKKAKAKAAA